MKKEKYVLSDLEILLITVLFFVINVVCSFVLFRPKFQDVTIELGTEEIDLNSFVTAKMYRKKSVCLTDIDEIDLSYVGERVIYFTYQDGRFKVKLNVVDTKSPDVKFKDVVAGSNYEFNVLDFIESVDDESKYEVKTNFVLEDSEKFKDYELLVDVIDIYGNKTNCCNC